MSKLCISLLVVALMAVATNAQFGMGLSGSQNLGVRGTFLRG
jgi:hypothetical protein